jgi:hypothetical protein
MHSELVAQQDLSDCRELHPANQVPVASKQARGLPQRVSVFASLRTWAFPAANRSRATQVKQHELWRPGLTSCSQSSNWESNQLERQPQPANQVRVYQAQDMAQRRRRLPTLIASALIAQARRARWTDRGFRALMACPMLKSKSKDLSPNFRKSPRKSFVSKKSHKSVPLRPFVLDLLDLLVRIAVRRKAGCLPPI